MQTTQPKENFWKALALYPVSLCFHAVVFVRNKLFDLDIIKSRHYKLPVISIGNISVGGTGKTPHSEYVIELLQQRWRVALLSRGYRRKTHGFLIGDSTSTAQTIGDEPYQILQKYPKITVAVDEKRVHGIDTLLQQPIPPQVVVLDDAYQHRYVTAGLSILLIDYNRLASKDYMMPLGRLREPVSNSDRADIIIVSKCPANIKPVDMMTLRKELNPFPFQQLFFSSYMYSNPKAVFESECNREGLHLQHCGVLAVSAIASAEPFHQYLKQRSKEFDSLQFPDHHFFTPKDFEDISKKFESLTVQPRMIVVTEKDRARLLNDASLPEQLKPHLYSIAIKVKFLNQMGETFDKSVIDYVEKSLSCDKTLQFVTKK